MLLVGTVNVYVPKDRVTNLHQGYGFVEFRSEEDADYVSSIPTSISFCLESFSMSGRIVFFSCLCRALTRMWEPCLGYQDPEHDQAVWQAHSSEQGELCGARGLWFDLALEMSKRLCTCLFLFAV